MRRSVRAFVFKVNHLFSAGSQIDLVIVNRDHPFFQPNIDQPKAWIYPDMNHPSALPLPVAP